MKKIIRIGTRESQLAVWQATQVKELLAENRFTAELVYIKNEGDVDLTTPLYEIGVQGIFTRELDIALLNNRIDIAVHSMKDVPVQLAEGLQQAAVLKRGPALDLLVYKGNWSMRNGEWIPPDKKHHSIATSSIRRKAQWLNKFPDHQMHNLRGNVNTRLKKLEKEDWDGALFALAGLERINLRPSNSIVLDWMLPAPAQGAIVVVCREGDDYLLEACHHFNDAETELCTSVERSFLKTLLGGCSTPISAFAEIRDGEIHFKGNILSPDGKKKASIEETTSLLEGFDFGKKCAIKLLRQGGQEIADIIHNVTK
jgi:hydroxymethylbilane synthase